MVLPNMPMRYSLSRWGCVAGAACFITAKVVDYKLTGLGGVTLLFAHTLDKTAPTRASS